MALFDLGTPTPRRGQQTPQAPPAKFRPIGRMEGSDPEIRALYERQKKQWEKEVEEERKKDKEAKKAYESKMKSQYGNQWRKRVAEQGRAKEYAAAQQALDERATVNRGLRETELPPMPKEDAKGDEMVDIPGGGKASADTVKMLYKRKGEQQAKKEAKETAFGRNIEKRYAAAYEANKQRYEEELASRGFTPPKTREEENEYNRERMTDFRIQIGAKERAARAERFAESDYRDLKRAAKEARNAGNYRGAINLERSARKADEMVGGDFRNVSARRKFFEDEANAAARQELEERANVRKKLISARTGANEASVGPNVVTTQPSTPPKPATTPKPPAPEDEIDIPEPNIPKPKPKPAPTQPFPFNAPRQPFQPPTSKDQELEDTLPGISSMPPIPTPKNATPAEMKEHNATVLDEYEKNVIIPSFSEDVQQAFLTAKDLNQRLSAIVPKGKARTRKALSPQQREETNKIEEELKPQREILKAEIDQLRKNSRDLARFPLNSEQAKLNLIKMATLKNQLSAIEKFFN